MTSNLRFITHSTQTDPHKFTTPRVGDGLTQTSFAYARRSEKTEDRTVPLGIELPHSQIFDQPLLNFLQVVVVAIKDLLRLIEIEIVLAQRVPRQIGNNLDVTHDH